MSFIEGIRVALSTLVTNKLRSALTMLGVIIGVSTIISLLSIGQSAQAQIESTLTSMGSNFIGVQTTGKWSLLPEDCEMLLERVPSISSAMPMIEYTVTVKTRDTMRHIFFYGGPAEMMTIMQYTPSEGRFFDTSDVEMRRDVVVLGRTTRKELFGERPAVGDTVSIMGQPLTVIGVASPKGNMIGFDLDDCLFVPYTTAQKILGTRYVTEIAAQAKSAELAPVAKEHIKRIFEEKFRNVERERDSRMGVQLEPFMVVSQDEMLSVINQVMGVFTVLLSGIAAVSLLVGGIGIMNIMLVSVTERTREIGIRKAIGARRKDIMAQFLIESAILSLVGGVIGALSGGGMAKLVGLVGKFKVDVSAGAIVTALLFSTCVGLFFGMYPASRAAKLDPIVALRHE
ncbi:MAG: ABC transporter permease [Bacillota bacterium]|nr:ABC transporter permease [Bacillota bacterium]